MATAKKADGKAIEDALSVLSSLADSKADEAKVKGIREWVCRKLDVPFHEEIKVKK